MNENYLLHNETAKKLYFEYAKNLPIIALCSLAKPSEQIYNNIAEAFLLNDFYKLDAMRHCGIDEKYITGDASDFEKFKAFCTVLPKFAGNPLYLLSHIELKNHFGCDLTICEENCDKIWNAVNSDIIERELSKDKILSATNFEFVTARYFMWYEDILNNTKIVDLYTLEETLIDRINEAEVGGCRIALSNAFSDFITPNQYMANEIVKRVKEGDKTLELEDFELLNMQINRTLCQQYRKLGWTLLIKGDNSDEEAVDYLEKNGVLPRIRHHIEFEIGQSEEYLELQIRSYALKNPIGNMIGVVNTAENSFSFARNDYFRRVLCNIIGKWVENGEYTSDEKVLKKLIEDILYNNLKEAIS